MADKHGHSTQCDVCGRRTWYEKEQQCHCSYPDKTTCETCGHTEADYDTMVRCTGTLRKI